MHYQLTTQLHLLNLKKESLNLTKKQKNAPKSFPVKIIPQVIV